MSFAEPGFIELLAPDWDWIWIDQQHGTMDVQSMRACVDACRLHDVPAVVRVPCLDEGAILHALDFGADAVMVPMVDTAEEAARAVKAAKFPPVGQRSFGGQRILIRAGMDYARNANEETLLIVQLETTTAMANIDEIAAVPGVDVLYVSPWDLAMSTGYTLGEPWPETFLVETLARFAEVAGKHDKIVGSFLLGRENVQLGVRYQNSLICAAIDTHVIREGSKLCAAGLRQS